MAIEEIDVEQVASRLAAGAALVDVREPDEYASGHVPGAVLVPMGDIPARLAELPTDVDLLVICRSGAWSMRVCEFLAAQGVPAANCGGGTLAWVASGRDVVTGASPE